MHGDNHTTRHRKSAAQIAVRRFSFSLLDKKTKSRIPRRSWWKSWAILSASLSRTPPATPALQAAASATAASGERIPVLATSITDFGSACGKMAAEILTEGADVSQMAVRYAPQFTKEYSTDICQAQRLFLLTAALSTSAPAPARTP